MATGPMSGIVEQLRRTALLRERGARTDGALLERFLASREEGAFEALLRRHGPMVLGVCRRVLQNRHDAEDAFQAAFLVLVRKAHEIVPRDALPSWLYGVAYRTALKARATNAKRRAKEMLAPERLTTDAPLDDAWKEIQPKLDRALHQLPDKYRLPVILCDLEGKSRKDAAQQLALPEGTLSSRLARAHRILARRLGRYGVTLPAGAVGMFLAQNAASAALPAPLIQTTMQAALLTAAGGTAAGAISAPVAALTEGVLRAMFMTKLKVVSVWLLAVGLLAAGAGIVTHQALAGKPAATEAALADKPAAQADAQKEEKKEKPKEAEASLHGIIRAIDPGKKTVTVSVSEGNKKQPPVEKTFALTDDTKVLLPGEKKGDRQEGKLADLATGDSVDLTLSADQKAVVTIGLHPPSAGGVVKSVDIAKNSITVTVHPKEKGQEPEEKAFVLGPEAKILLPGGKSKNEPAPEGKLADLLAGTSVQLRLAVDRKTVLGIQVQPPRAGGGIKKVDIGGNTITITSKGEGGPVEETFGLAVDVNVFLPSEKKAPLEGKLADLAEGLTVNLQLTVDRKMVVSIAVSSPSIAGTVRGTTGDSLTIESKDDGQLVERAFAVAGDVPVTNGKGEGKLADVKEGTAVVLRLSLDRKTVLGIAVQPANEPKKK